MYVTVDRGLAQHNTTDKHESAGELLPVIICFLINMKLAMLNDHKDMQPQASLARASSLPQERHDEHDTCTTQDQEWFGHLVPLFG